jgi:hypothetical protein
MTSSHRPLCAILLAVALAVASGFPALLSAQDAPPAPGGGPAGRLTGVLSAIAPESLVRVTTAGYRLEAAAVAGFDARTVTLRQEDLSIDIPLADVRGVDVRSSHWLQGMLWGGLSGTALGSVLGVIVGSWGCLTPDECNDAENRGGVLGGVVGGTVGGLTGFMIGRHSLYWRPLFP